jgi:glycosyltransferase 2 family protein
MGQKRILVTLGVALILAVLVYLQFRTWSSFEWSKLLDYRPQWRHVVHAIVVIYFGYFLRAVRWKIFLRPVRKHASMLGLVPPTLIGFTGLALLGRPGELIRPYLIARRENLSVASQLGVWAVERIFDIGGFTVLLVAFIFLPTSLREFARSRPSYSEWIHATGYMLIALTAGLFVGATAVRLKGPAIAGWVEKRFSHLAANLGHRIAQRVREFAAGLNAIHGFWSLAQITAVSLLMWWMIAVAYKEVTIAYGGPMHEMTSAKVLLLMGSSMLGSMVQLPGVGGGSQLATITALDHVFDIPKELAVSCGILLWLVTFVAVVPLGLLLAHHERLSLRKLSEESHQEDASVLSADQPPA